MVDIYKLNSEFVGASSGNGRGRHLKNIEGRMLYPFYILIVGMFISLFLLSTSTAFVILIMVIVTSIYFGLQAYGEYQLFSSTPIAKIDGAADGLCEIQADVLPYKDHALSLPIGDGKCAYYELELHFKTGGRNSQDYVLGEVIFGAPSLLFDSSGYLYGDFGSAEFEMPYRTYVLRRKKFEWVLDREKIIKAFADTTAAGQQLDMGKYDDNLFLDQYGEESVIRVSKWGAVSNSPVGYYVRLYYVPVEKPYFMIGNVSDSGKLYNEKPLKMFSIDPNTGILAITSRSKQQLTSRLRNYAFLDLGLALLCLLMLVWLFNLTLT